MLFRALLLATLPALAQAAPVDFDAAHWQASGAVEFSRAEGFPHGMLTLQDKADAELPGAEFGDGTLEFDMKATGDGMPGLRFHKQGDTAGEEFYLRTQPDCRAENDCVQYAPIIQGSMLWNVYPQYQSKAPVMEGWNHYKLVMSGRHLDVFVNGEPTIKAHLESDSMSGGIALAGPAVFANLTLQREEERPIRVI